MNNMKKELFLEMLKDASDKIDCKKMDEQIKRTMDPNPIFIGKPGTRNLIIIIEELAELQEVILDIHQQTPSMTLNKDNALHLQEELGDVIMAMKYVQFICDISDTELDTCSRQMCQYKYQQDEAVLKTLLNVQMILTKYLRGSEKITKELIMQNIIKVLNACICIATVYNVPQADINKGMNVKLKRLENTEHIYM